MILIWVSFLSYCKKEKFFETPLFNFPAYDKSLKKIGPVFDIDKLPSEVNYILINFFAPRCPPCIEEVPVLNQFYKKIKSKKKKDTIFIGLGSTLDSIGQQESIGFEKIASDVGKFTQEYQLDYPIYLADANILRSFNVTGFPETFIFLKKKSGHIPVLLLRRFISSVTFMDLERSYEYHYQNTQ